MGYAEKTQAVSKYKFLSDGTFTISTKYGNTIVISSKNSASIILRGVAL